MAAARRTLQLAPHSTFAATNLAAADLAAGDFQPLNALCSASVQAKHLEDLLEQTVVLCALFPRIVADLDAAVGLRITCHLHATCINPGMGAKSALIGCAGSAEVQTCVNSSSIEHLPGSQRTRKTNQRRGDRLRGVPDSPGNLVYHSRIFPALSPAFYLFVKLAKSSGNAGKAEAQERQARGQKPEARFEQQATLVRRQLSEFIEERQARH